MMEESWDLSGSFGDEERGAGGEALLPECHLELLTRGSYKVRGSDCAVNTWSMGFGYQGLR